MNNQKTPFIDRPIFALVILLAVAVVLLLLDRGIGEGWLSWNYWRETQNNISRSEVFRNLGLFAVAVIGLGFGIWRARTASLQAHAANAQAESANRQVTLAQEGQITDRYAKAVEMLSSTNPRTRTGAVYALARIAQDSIERDHIPVMEVLSEFIRRPPYGDVISARQAAREAADLLIPTFIKCPDIHAALRVISQRNANQRSYERNSDFSVSLRRADLRELDLQDAPLSGFDLTNANLTSADLQSADLSDTQLATAFLVDANLLSADLTGAKLQHSHMTNAFLLNANLKGANLRGAELNRADLTIANLTGANLSDANLIGADLDSADLGGATITQGQIDSCNPIGQKPRNLPEGLIWPHGKNQPAAPNGD